MISSALNSSILLNIYADYEKVRELIKRISLTNENITLYMDDTRETLDKAVHGHNKAKRQVERIIGQWINGKNEGYSFGFEGPPGVGKTSLAKNEEYRHPMIRLYRLTKLEQPINHMVVYSRPPSFSVSLIRLESRRP